MPSEGQGWLPWGHGSSDGLSGGRAPRWVEHAQHALPAANHAIQFMHGAGSRLRREVILAATTLAAQLSSVQPAACIHACPTSEVRTMLQSWPFILARAGNTTSIAWLEHGAFQGLPGAGPAVGAGNGAPYSVVVK